MTAKNAAITFSDLVASNAERDFQRRIVAPDYPWRLLVSDRQ
jgi:hypothetical protein